MQITPAILVSTYSELKKQLKKSESITKIVQLDIMDGVFVDNKSFDYNEDRDLASFFNNLDTKLEYELHLMVEHPLEAIDKWINVKNIYRVVTHIESKDNITETISKIKGNCWQAGLAMNPDTDIQKIKPYLEHIKIIQFMTVVPGKQGNSFKEDVKKKIQEISKLETKPLISVDGGINKDNIQSVKSWGVDIFNVGSALMGAEDIEKEYNNLSKLIR